MSDKKQNSDISSILFDLIHPKTYRKLNSILNRQLANNPDFSELVENLKGNVISVGVNEPTALEIYIVFLQDKILVKEKSQANELTPDVTILGSMKSMLMWLCWESTSDIFLENLLEIEGDPLVLQEVRKLIATLDVHWAYELQDLIGDNGLIIYTMAEALLKTEKLKLHQLREKLSILSREFKDRIKCNINSVEEEYISELYNFKAKNVYANITQIYASMYKYENKIVEFSKLPLELKEVAPWQKKRGMKDYTKYLK